MQLINDLNERGEVVGGMNIAGDQSFHPFLWDGRRLRDLGTLGGDLGSAERTGENGQVVGWSWTTGNQAAHAFLWRAGVLTDLGTVDGDPNSVAYGINSAGQIVGGTTQEIYLSTFLHAFLWENGSIADLNELISPGSHVQLVVAPGINEQGQIVAQGSLPNGDLHAFLLTPCDEHHPGIEGCDYSMVEAPAAQTGVATQKLRATRQTTQSSANTSNQLRNAFGRRLPGQRPAPHD